MFGDGEDPNDLVTVVVPCYNDGEYLLENLESLEKQTYRNFEVVIVNDGSTDPKTLEILEDLEQAFPLLDIRVYSQSNLGLPATRNRGIREARGEWVVTLDADDMIAPNYLEKTVALAQARDLDFVATDIQNFGVQEFIAQAKISFYEELFRCGMSACALFRRSVLLAEPYDPDFNCGFEDWELWIRLLSKGYRGEVIHEPLFLYRRKHESMITSTHFLRPQLVKKMREKHAELYESNRLSRIRKQSPGGTNIKIWLNRIHYIIGLRFPHLASWFLRSYLRLRPYVGH